MSLIPVIGLALITFIIAIVLMRLPKSGWAVFGATLLFGLTGYALQGNPGYAGAPKDAAPVASEVNFALVDARREFFGLDRVPSRFVTVSDAFSRKGQFGDAANMLTNALQDNPKDTEAWVALGNALVEHANGALTPPALYAYDQAETLDPGNAAAGYFLGIGLLRSGKPQETREIWAKLVENAPDDASWKALLADRLARLDQILTETGPSPQ